MYHDGQKPLVLKTFTQGDYVTAIFDTESRTLSFAKNNDYPVVAFQNIDTKSKLYPCVLCYSTAAGQKVYIIINLYNSNELQTFCYKLFYSYRLK